MSDIQKEVSELKREILETRNQVIKTDHQIKNLGLDFKNLERRFERFEVQLRFSGWLGQSLIALTMALAVYGFCSLQSFGLKTQMQQIKDDALRFRQETSLEKENLQAKLASLESAQEQRQKAVEAINQLEMALETKNNKEALLIWSRADVHQWTQIERRWVEKNINEAMIQEMQSGFTQARKKLLEDQPEMAIEVLNRLLTYRPHERLEQQTQLLLAGSWIYMGQIDKARPILDTVMRYKNLERALKDEAQFLYGVTLSEQEPMIAKDVFRRLTVSSRKYAGMAQRFINALEKRDILPRLRDERRTIWEKNSS